MSIFFGAWKSHLLEKLLILDASSGIKNLKLMKYSSLSLKCYFKNFKAYEDLRINQKNVKNYIINSKKL